ncbi:MAG: cob(I)yrinic acid a,c-diamide adenosyltransferase [Lachnospiraceae bacterium]|jgi:cob(I)alamin adenosyltransferase
MIQIYCGDGKGKTTAALGLAIRAAGRGKRVLIARFLKTDDSGEVPVLSGIPGIQVMPCKKTFGFYFRMTDQQKKEAAEYYSQQFEEVKTQAEEFDLIILDEIMAACNYQLVSENAVVQWLEKQKEQDFHDLEVVLTGRNPSQRMQELADYITEMKLIRHPYEKGISARIGIEY